MKYFIIILSAFYLILCNKAQAQLYFLGDKKAMQENKGIAKTRSQSPELTTIIKNAEIVLNKREVSVAEKKLLPASKNRNDYYSLATYWWPDVNKGKDAPYIRKDGQANPSRLEISDFTYLKRICEDIRTLGYAYYFTSDKKYAEKAEKLLYTWFVNPTTKMNPNLEFSQVILGKNNNKGRAEGLIDTKNFVYMLEGVELMSTDGGLSNGTIADLKKWFSEYLNWLVNSPIGQKGGALKNNLATTYYLQVLAYSKFIDIDKNRTLAQSIINKGVKNLLTAQFDNYGRQPLELTRTNSWSYSVSNLTYWFNIANLAEDFGIDLWNFTPKNKKILASGLTYLNENAFKNWKHQQDSPTSLKSSVLALNTIAIRKINGFKGISIDGSTLKGIDAMSLNLLLLDN